MSKGAYLFISLVIIACGLAFYYLDEIQPPKVKQRKRGQTPIAHKPEKFFRVTGNPLDMAINCPEYTLGYCLARDEYKEGWAAFENGKNFSDNPYPRNTDLIKSMDWDAGHCDHNTIVRLRKE